MLQPWSRHSMRKRPKRPSMHIKDVAFFRSPTILHAKGDFQSGRRGRLLCLVPWPCYLWWPIRRLWSTYILLESLRALSPLTAFRIYFRSDTSLGISRGTIIRHPLTYCVFAWELHEEEVSPVGLSVESNSMRCCTHEFKRPCAWT